MTANKQTTWVITIDSNNCRIYDYSKKPNHLTLVKEIQHPENKLRDIDLTSDKPGHYKSSGTGGQGTYSQPTDPKEIKIDNFAREIAKELDHGRNTNAYQQLIVIAGPQMKGLLCQHINKHVESLITHKIEKDILHLNTSELMDFLQIHARYSSE